MYFKNNVTTVNKNMLKCFWKNLDHIFCKKPGGNQKYYHFRPLNYVILPSLKPIKLLIDINICKIINVY